MATSKAWVFGLGAAVCIVAAVGGWFAGRTLADAAADGRVLAQDRLESVGVWSTHADLGAAQSDRILRAWVARTAILPLAGGEVDYFWTTRDSSGAPLLSECAYTVTIPDIDARWWSLAAYDERFRPIANELDRYSINSSAGVTRFTVARAASPQSADWLPLGEVEQFELFFRVYQPGEAFDNRAIASLPTIEKAAPC